MLSLPVMVKGFDYQTLILENISGYLLGPRRFTNVFDESKVNRTRIFAMFWTEYCDSLAYSKYPSDNRSTHRGNPVTCQHLRNRTIHLLLFIAFAVALTFIMLFIFNLIIRPSLFIRFSSPLQCHFECFSDRVQRINVLIARSRRLRWASLGRSRVMLIASGSPVAAMKAKLWRCVYRVELLERNKGTFGSNDRQKGVLSLIGKISRESMTRRRKALFRDCYCRGVIMPAVSWCRQTTWCGCRHFVRNKCIREYIFVFATLYSGYKSHASLGVFVPALVFINAAHHTLTVERYVTTVKQRVLFAWKELSIPRTRCTHYSEARNLRLSFPFRLLRSLRERSALE